MVDKVELLRSSLHEKGSGDKYSTSRILAAAATIEFLILAPAVLALLIWGPLTVPMLEVWGPWAIKFFAGALFPLVINYAKRAFRD